MSLKRIRLFVLVIILVAALPANPARSESREISSPPPVAPDSSLSPVAPASSPSHVAPASSRIRQNAGATKAPPLTFVPNHGQTDPAVAFQARAMGGTLFFTSDEVVLAMADVQDGAFDKRLLSLSKQLSLSKHRHQANLRVQFVGANPNATIAGQEQLPGVVNSYIGDDPAQWHTNIPTYGGIVYHRLYDGIDLHYNGTQQGLKGTYTIAPGGAATPGSIRWRYAGADSVRVDESTGNLLITLDAQSGAGIVEQAPIAWQTIDGQRVPVDIRYAITANDTQHGPASAPTVGFAVGSYHPDYPLVIDPELAWSTYLGGSDNEYVYDMELDNESNVYITGKTFSTNFPTASAYQGSNNGGWDAFVSKISSDGSTLLYSTYLGGTSTDTGRGDAGNGITVDKTSGHAYIAGTAQGGFPILNALQSTFKGPYFDAFISGLDANGTLVFSTYYGSTTDDGGTDITLDTDGNIYITGSTRNSTNFPLSDNAFQTTYGGGDWDTFVAKLNADASEIIYSSLLGGVGSDGVKAIAVDSTGNAYVTGNTYSTDFPTEKPFQAELNGTWNDAFITKINPDGSAILYSSYLGGTYADDGYAIALDSSNNAYIAGVAWSSNFPTTPGVAQETTGGSHDAFVAKVSSTGETLLFSSYLGGSENEEAYDITLDADDNIYVAGKTLSDDFPILHPYQATFGGGTEDAFIAKMSNDGSTLLMGSYLGGSGDEQALSIALDSAGSIYVAGDTTSTDFPTANALYGSNAGLRDAFATKLNFFMLTDTTIEANAVDAPSNMSMSFTFNKPIDQGTVTADTLVVRGSQHGDYTGTFSFPTTKTVVFDPAKTFKPGEHIAATLTAGIRSDAGVSTSPFTWQFQTEVQDGTGVFTDSGQVIENSSWTEAALGDVDGDGDLDAFLAKKQEPGGERPTPNELWLNDGNGVFSNSGQSMGSEASRGLKLGDLDGDGDLDAFVPAFGENKTWFNDGNGTFTEGQMVIEENGREVDLGDLDGDGDLDVFLVNHGDNIVWFNDGSGTFTSGQSLSGGETTDVELGDIDSDGDLDAFTTYRDTFANRLWLNDGNGTFTDSGQSMDVSVWSYEVDLGDIDNDGDLDAVVANTDGAANTVWLNDGKGTFTLDQSLGNSDSMHITLGDIDADSDLDIFVSNYGQDNTIWLNDGSGTFTDSGQAPGSLDSQTAELGDLDGDGDLDAFVTGYLIANQVWFNINKPTLSIADPTALTEGNSGTKTLAFPVTLSAAADVQVTVDWATADGTATLADNDYATGSGTLTFAPGVTEQTASVTINGDTKVEGDETFFVNLSNVSVAATIADAQATGTIQNDDSVTLSIADPTALAEGNSGTQTLAFPVTLSAAAGITVTVDWATADGTATLADNDYATGSGTLTFAPGVTEQTASVTINGDTKVETDETFFVNLSNAIVATIETAQATGTIISDDTATISPTDVEITEGDSGTVSANIPVQLSQASTSIVAVDWATSDGTATANANANDTSPADYTASNGTLTFQPGTTVQTATVTINGDTWYEPDETLSVVFSNAQSASIPVGKEQATITIRDNETVAFSIDDVDSQETDGKALYTVSAAGASHTTLPITLTIATTDGTATSPADYGTPTPALLSFAADKLNAQTVSVPIVQDNEGGEPNETYTVDISLDGTYDDRVSISKANGNGVIIDSTAVSFSLSDTTASESADALLFTVSASGASNISEDVTLLVDTANSSDVGTPQPAKLSFGDGNMGNKEVRVPIIPDTINEFDETFTISLRLDRDYNNATIGDGEGIGTIQDDDHILFSIQDAEARKADPNIVFTVAITGATTSVQTIQLVPNITDGTATQGTDIGAPQPATIVLTVGHQLSNQKIAVPILENVQTDRERSFTLNLALDNATYSGVTLNPNTATGTIIDDGTRLVNFSNPTYYVTEGDGQATINVTLRPPINEEVRVDYTVAEAADMANAATANQDFTPTSGTLVFASGETSKQITVDIAEDSLDEYAEPISLSLANPQNAEIGSSGNATLFISEDPSDQPPTVQFDQATYREYEDIGVALIPMHLTYASGKTISVQCHAEDGTATSPDDYAPPAYAITFAPGTTEKSCRVPIFNDVLNEDDETLTLSLAVDDTDSVLLGNQVQATFTIADDNDPLPIVTPSVGELQICESAGTVPVTITLNTTSGKTVAVEYSTINGTATTDDYTFQRDTITFAPQQTTQVINIPITPDNLYEQPDEHFWLGLRTAEGADIGNVEAARITIIDADIHGVCGVPGVQFAQDEYTANEYDATATFTLTLSKPSEQPITVLYDTVGGSATPYGDYKPKSSSITFAPGEMSKPVVVTLVDDKDIEGTVEVGVQVRLGESGGAVRLGEPALATLNILDDDAPPQGALHFSKATYRTSEDSRHMVIVVERTGGSEGTVTIEYATTNDNAFAGLDYEASQGTLTFGPGEVEHTFVVSITEDVEVEGDERINLHLSNPTGGAALGKQHDAALIITDNEEAPHGVLAFTLPRYDTNEDSKTATVYVQRTSGNTGTVTVEYSTFEEKATATAGSDYTAVKGVLIFSPTQTMQSFTIPIIDDAMAEGNETIDLRLGTITGGAVHGNTQEAVLEIVDNDAPPEGIVEFSQDTYEVQEDAGTATINVYRTGLEGTMRVDYTTLEQSATAGNDYAKRSGTLTFAPGHTKATITISITNDTKIEGNKTVQLQLKNVVGGLMGSRHVATLIIIDDDMPKAGVVQFHTDIYEVNEDGTQTTIEVERTGGFTKTMTVDYATYPAPNTKTSAIAGSDYLTSSGTLTFPPGIGTQVFTVTINEDTEMEGNEKVQLRLSNVQSTLGTQLGNDSATLTIIDNDLPPEGMLQFSVEEYFVNEDEISATITVERKSGSVGMVGISYATADGGATVADGDYESRSGTLTFQPYDTFKTFSIPIITDARIEGDEDINLILENVTRGAWLGTQNEATLTIKDCQECAGDDEDTEPAGVFQFDPVHEQIHENSGMRMMTVRRVNGDHGEVTVDYETLPNGGTATADTDYQPTRGTLTFDEGITERTFPVNIMDDINVELDETIILSLTHATNGATIGSNGTAVLTIVENDLPVVGFVSAFGEDVSSDMQVDEDKGILKLPIQLSMKVENTIVVTYTTTWNAESPHYDTVIFAPETTHQTIPITIADNITLEPDKTLVVELQSATHATLDTERKRLITVRDDDGPARMAMHPMHTWLVADGKSTTVVTATVYDRRDNPVPNHCVAFSTTSGQVAPSIAQTNATGVATTTLTSSATPDVAKVTAQSCAATYAHLAHTQISTVARMQTVAPASSRNRQDAIPVARMQTVAPASSRNRQDAGATTQQNDVSGATTVVFGYLSVYLPYISSTPGPYRVFMDFDTDTPVVRVGSAANPTNITLHAMFADYISPATKTTVKLQTSLGTFDNGQTTMSTQTDENGNVTFDLYPGEVAGTAIVSASIQTEKLFGEDALEVGFAGVPTQVAMEATAQRLPLAGSTTVAVTLHDVYDNLVPQQEVTFSTDLGTVDSSATTDTGGQASAQFACPVNGNGNGNGSKSTATVSASAAGLTKDVQIVCGAPELLTLAATPKEMEARVGSTSTINATVQDTNKALIAGQEVLFTANAGMLSVAQSTTNADGAATTTLLNPTLLTGNMTVMAQADGLTETVAIEVTPVELTSDQVGNSIARPGIFPSLDAAYAIATDTNTYVDSTDNTDYYRFDVHGVYTVTLYLRDIPDGADYDLALAQANRRVARGESRNSGNVEEYLSLRLTRGMYYVQVQKKVRGSSTQEAGYTLAVIAE